MGKMKDNGARNQHMQQQEVSWRRVVVRKWLTLAASNSDYSADTDSGCSDSDSERQFCQWPRESDLIDQIQVDSDDPGARPRRRRRNSETFRAHYIDKKEIRICAATWNVGGRVLSDDLDLSDWLQIDDPADLYVIGLQEIIPLNAGNIFGAEDSRPVSRWEDMIRETLDEVPPFTAKYKSYSDPPSPSKFKPSDDAPDVENGIEWGNDLEEEIFPLLEEESTSSFTEETSVFPVASELEEKQLSSYKKLCRLNCLKIDDFEECLLSPKSQNIAKLSRALSGTEKIGLSWPDPPLHLLSHHVLVKESALKSYVSFKSTKSFRACRSSSRLNLEGENRTVVDVSSLAELDLESLINRKRRAAYVRIVSKQMVGMLITIWVRRSLRKHIQNVNVSAVGVGAMGYIGNKGSISVSMSIHQTLFCFICCHLAAGEKDSDVMRRNADVYEIHRRTRFSSSSSELPKRIYNHERIIWLGDLNYRINLPYERTKELISNEDWPQLVKHDQLVKEQKHGGAFSDWSEGTLNFAPTYKYEYDSDSYIQDNHKTGRRTPAWCDRILSYGAGMKQLSYQRTEIRLSDHRPVAASYIVEVEVFCPKKLQRALTFTDAEVEQNDSAMDLELRSSIARIRPSEQDQLTYWEL